MGADAVITMGGKQEDAQAIANKKLQGMERGVGRGWD
jgi:hypothetical protein